MTSTIFTDFIMFRLNVVISLSHNCSRLFLNTHLFSIPLFHKCMTPPFLEVCSGRPCVTTRQHLLHHPKRENPLCNLLPFKIWGQEMQTCHYLSNSARVCVYVCMYVCVCMCVCMCVHACTHMCLYVHVCTCTHTHVCVYMYVNICTHVCEYVCVYVCVHVFVCMCVHTNPTCVHVCVYMYVYMYVHACTHMYTWVRVCM